MTLFLSLPALSQVMFSNQIILSNSTREAMFVYAADLDSDGDQDIISASLGNHTVAWFENIDGKGTFSAEKVISNAEQGISNATAADLDGDGDADIVTAAYLGDKISWYQNTNGAGEFELAQEVSNTADGAIAVFISDLDGDQDLDIIGAAWELNQIIWYENLDGSGNFGAAHEISNEATGVSCVYGADLDLDGDQDILAALPEADKVVWYENLDGNGSFSTEKLITNETANVLRTSAADIDMDGDLDVVSVSSEDNKVAWYENLNGNGEFGGQQLITTNATGVFYHHVADIDNDADMDIVATFSDNIAWYENRDGKGSFSNHMIISTNAQFGHCVYSADIDADGDQDVLSASWGDHKIAWYRNELISVGPGESNGDGIIAFSNTPPDGNNDIYLINSDGTGLEQLTSGPHRECGPSWSPDGSRIAYYIHYDNLTWSLFMMDADGSNNRRLTNTTNVCDNSISWSPDGEWLAFDRMYPQDNYRSEIWLIKADGSDLHRLSNYDGGGPCWSPDGSKIAFSLQENGRSSIAIMDSDGTDLEILNEEGTENYNPDWSHDGTKIAFGSNRSGDREIYVMNADGSDPVKITNNTGWDDNPVWSPDDEQIAYTAWSDERFEIKIINPDGTNPFRVARMPTHCIQAAWKPADLSEVAYLPTSGNSQLQNYPNPVTSHTTFSFVLDYPSDITLTLIDLHGRVMETVHSGNIDAGKHTIEADLSHLDAGIYQYNLASPTRNETKQLIKLN